MSMHDPQFQNKRIDREKIRRRWFRNHYVLLFMFGYKYNFWIYEAGTFDPSEFDKSIVYYGPFRNEKDAEDFKKNLDHHIYCAIFA